MNMAVSALRFFYTRTLDRPDLTRKLHRVKHPRSLPTVLSRDEVMRMPDATTSIEHQAILSVAYGAGLRASEVTRLKVRDIDSERMLLRVQCGKHVLSLSKGAAGTATPCWRRICSCFYASGGRSAGSRA